jgi:hypothetical protein
VREEENKKKKEGKKKKKKKKKRELGVQIGEGEREEEEEEEKGGKKKRRRGSWTLTWERGRMKKVVMVRGVGVGVEAGERINKNLEKVELREKSGRREGKQEKTQKKLF